MNDDLDEEVIGSDEGFDELVQKNSLGDLWRNSPLMKVGVVVLAASAVFGTILFFGGSKEKAEVSVLPPGSTVSAPPGTEAATPAYIAAVEAQNEAELERAIQEQDSTLPVPIETPSERLQLPEEEEAEEDPLHRWRRLQEERVVRETKVRDEMEPVTVVDSEQQSEAMQKLADSMSKQMEAILGKNSQDVSFTYVSLFEPEDTQAGVNGAGASADDDLGEEIDEATFENIIVAAGDIEYAQLLTEANSDVPGPVLALLVSGPLKGSKVIGTFKVKNDKYLTLEFDTVVVDRKSVDITAIALDPDTTLPGMATEVDHRYLQRVVLPAAAAFVEGFTEAISESGSTNITIDTGGTSTSTTNEDKNTEQEVATGFQEAGEEIRDIIDDINDDVKVLVKIHAGTPIGILFTEPVVAEDDVELVEEDDI